MEQPQEEMLVSSRLLPRIFAVVLVTLLAEQLVAQSSDAISLRDRVMTASTIYHQIATFYPELSQKQFDHDYGEYLTEILGPSVDRRSFDLASMALVATLHDGHTWFYDDWLDQTYGPAVCFAAYPLDGQWVVVRSELASLRAGEVIEAIDGTPAQPYFERNRKYISASSDRDAGVSFFDTPVLFPERFTLTLDGGRHVTIDRKNDKRQELAAKTEGRWLAPGSVAYIRIPNFRGIETQAAAIDYLRQYHDAKAIILDVRGNPGLGDPTPLQMSLMDKPYQMWTEHSSMKGGLVLREHGTAPEVSRVTTSESR